MSQHKLWSGDRKVGRWPRHVGTLLLPRIGTNLFCAISAFCAPRRWLLYAAAVWILLSPGKVEAFQDEPDSLWKRIDLSPHRTLQFALDVEHCSQLLAEGTRRISLPLPDGSIAQFDIERSAVMPPELAAKFPGIKSFTGTGTSDRQTSVKLDMDRNGLRAKIFTPDETIHVFPPESLDGRYVSITGRDAFDHPDYKCLAALEAPIDDSPRLANLGFERGGRQLRIFRIAIAVTGEFAQAAGGTKESAMATVVGVLNKVNGIYERELGIRLQLVPNNDRLIFLNPDSDPFSENQANTTTLLENQNAIDRLIGPGEYDVGHFFNTGQFGLAYISVVCRDNWKARGGIGNSTGDIIFFPNFVAHEIAHQFGANHTFNSVAGMCGGARNRTTAFEPGSGSTLMGYAGFCDEDNLQAHGSDYFHSISYDEIQQFITSGNGASCAQIVSTGNNPPVVDSGSHFVIPKGTAFRLTASGHDPDGDTVTFCWEQRDNGPAQNIYEGDNGESPLFRSEEPSRNPTRTFPRMETILGHGSIPGEQVPQTGRQLHFRVTARDNRGGIGTADTTVAVANTGSPFVITSHTSSDTYFGVQTITWEVGGTASAPIHANQVNILLSTNGGASFNVVLAANVPNDGSERVVFPNTSVDSARLRIDAVGQIFFAVNLAPFSIQPNTTEADFDFDGNVDLLWQHVNGQLNAWLMNGSKFLKARAVRPGNAAPRSLRVASVYDFNGDSRVDLLWQHANGSAVVWFLDGNEFVDKRYLRDNRRMAAGWKIVTARDLDQDGQPDILWQHTNGRLAIWRMNGSDFTQQILLRNGKGVSPGWQAIAVTDVNSDGANDILFRHSTGNFAAWLMNGAEFKKNVPLGWPAMDRGWTPGAVADLDKNGQNDIVWNHSGGAIRVWYLAGPKLLRTGTLRSGAVPPQWRLVGPR